MNLSPQLRSGISAGKRAIDRVFFSSVPLLVFILVVAVGFRLPCALGASDVHYGPGTHLESLVVPGTTYQDVQIRSVTAHTVVFTHRGGMASLHLRDLPIELQTCFGYKPADDQPTSSPSNLPVAPAAPAFRRADRLDTDRKMPALLRHFGQTPELRSDVDLRPQFFEFELSVKNQGRRPSCAIFAIVCALEFQNSRLKGHAEALSEEYLSWATRKTSRSTNISESNDQASGTADDDADEGFSLSEVVAALRDYGIPLQSSMPNTFGHSISGIHGPSPVIIESARNRQNIGVYGVPGSDNAQRINNLIHILNADIPVAIGLAWPHFRAVRSAYLGKQTPQEGAGHAVTLVGYKATEGRIEDTEFFFKNSWGSDWGRGGYGIVTYGYLEKNLQDAVLLVVEKSISTAR